MGSVLQLGLGAVQGVEDGRDARVVVRHVGQRVDGAAGQAFGVGIVVFRHGLQCSAGTVDQRLPVGQALVFSRQLGPFAIAGGQFFQLIDLPGQAFTFAQQLITALACLLQRVGRGLAGGK